MKLFIEVFLCVFVHFQSVNSQPDQRIEASDRIFVNAITGLIKGLDSVDILFNSKGAEIFSFTPDVDPKELLNRGFDPNKETKIVTHGWTRNRDECIGYRNAYNANMDVNFFCIDWGTLASVTNYPRAAKNAIKVGQFIGEKLVAQLLVGKLGQSAQKIHAIGHSLGGHLVGNIGKAARDNGSKIARVTGLDPAKPLFEHGIAFLNERLSKNDADLVDVIHTHSSNDIDALGLYDPIGDADFYPNGGVHQAGCKDVCHGSSCLTFRLFDLLKLGCSHNRAPEFYVESILNAGKKFMSTSCDSYDAFTKGVCGKSTAVPMGEGFSAKMLKSSGNVYYLDTNEVAPFSQS